MKKHEFTAALLLAVLLSALALSLSMNFVSAQTGSAPEIIVESPVEGKTYTTSNVDLKFSVKLGAEGPGIREDIITYQLEGESAIVLPEEMTSANVILEKLPNGEHKVAIYAKSTFTWYYSSTYSDSVFVNFFVEKAPPRVSFISGQQQTFNSGVDVSFNFTVFETEGVSWLGYSLDEGEVVPVTDNVTFTVSHRLYNYQLTMHDLSDGVHSLTVYAEDLAGNNGESEPFQFTVGQEAQLEPDQSESDQSFPTTWVALTIVALVAIVSFGLLAYSFKFKKRKH